MQGLHRWCELKNKNEKVRKVNDHTVMNKYGERSIL